jgi:hypothetical protein
MEDRTLHKARQKPHRPIPAWGDRQTRMRQMPINKKKEAVLARLTASSLFERFRLCLAKDWALKSLDLSLFRESRLCSRKLLLQLSIGSIRS